MSIIFMYSMAQLVEIHTIYVQIGMRLTQLLPKAARGSDH